MSTLILWLLVVVFVGAFAVQVATRVRLIAAAPNTFSFDDLGSVRLRVWLTHSCFGDSWRLAVTPSPNFFAASASSI